MLSEHPVNLICTIDLTGDPFKAFFIRPSHIRRSNFKSAVFFLSLCETNDDFGKIPCISFVAAGTIKPQEISVRREARIDSADRKLAHNLLNTGRKATCSYWERVHNSSDSSTKERHK